MSRVESRTTSPGSAAEGTAEPIRPLRWAGEESGALELIDQTLLPERLTWIRCATVESLYEAIRMLRVRGAPAIGCAAAFGVVTALNEAGAAGARDWRATVAAAAERLNSARPTAVNLAWALARMGACAAQLAGASFEQARAALLAEARAIRDEDAATCRAIGRHGAPLIGAGAGVLTHCNAGALATAEFGTALGPIYTAFEEGRRFRVYADETRPLLQGARLTAWELRRAGIDVTLICDNMAAQIMREGRIDLVIVGADRIAANGDTANKIGTYGVAVIARHHGVPFYVAAPRSTFDRSLATGREIPIEHRDSDEIRRGFGRLTAPADVPCHNPAFDVTPAELIAGIITERGIVRPVTAEAIGRLWG
ncbi:MAG: S-methyl-5-thioribose-1-phosphate isomerase [Phycisphaerae bacterium]